MRKSFSRIASRLLLVGFALTFAGTVLIMASAVLSDGNSSVSIVIIGPIPIIIGSGPYAILAIFMAAVLTIVCLLMFFLMRRRIE